jgi:cobalt-zinc-cadmium efflux system outer membrane protein
MMTLWSLIMLARAEADGALALSEVLASVDAHLPTLVIADQEMSRAEGALLEARGAFDLRWDASGAWTTGEYSNTRVETGLKQSTPLWGLDAWAKYKLGVGDFATYDGGKQSAPGEVAVGLDLPLWRDGPIDRERAAIRVATLGVDGAEARLGAARIAAKRDATLAYHAWTASGARRELAAEQLRVAQDRATGIAARVAAGDLPGIEAQENDRVLTEREAALTAADRDLRQAAYTLSLYLRSPDAAPAPPSDDRLPTFGLPPQAGAPDDAESLVTRAWASRPELTELGAVAQQADVRADQAANRRAPRVDLQGSVGRELGPDPKVPIEARVGLVLGLEVQQRSARGAVAQARADEARTEAQIGWLKDQIRAQVLSQLAARSAARARWALAIENVSLTRQLEAAVRADFEQGGATLFEVYLREQNTAAAVRGLVDAAFEYHAAEAQLTAALGGTPAP